MTLKQTKPRGRPFKKGADERRHMEGRKSRDAIQFKQEYIAALVKRLDPDKLAEVLAAKAMSGQPWALSELHDRLFGKPTQQIEEKKDAVVRFVFPEPNGGPLLEAGKGTAALPAAPGATAALEAEVVDEGKDCTEEELREACEKAATGGE